jgi:hypothetical protein
VATSRPERRSTKNRSCPILKFGVCVAEVFMAPNGICSITYGF